jgi:hypothetical protein
MPHWKTRMCLHAERKLIQTEDIKIECGIFQGDSLSPLLFCICLIPLTQQLDRLNTGYEEHTTKTKISHLLYMDDLKLIAKSEEELQRQIQLKLSVMIFIWNLNLKNVTITLKRGKLISSQNLVIDNNREIQELEQGKYIQVPRD